MIFSRALSALSFALGGGPVTIHLHRSTVAQKKTNLQMGGGVYPQAIYWTMLEVGTPSVPIPVIVDTGSPFVEVAGAGCQNCLHTPPNAAYDPSASSTSQPYKKVPSSFEQKLGVRLSPDGPDTWFASYQTCDPKHPTDRCSMEGKLFQDKVSLGGLGPVDVVLGTIENQSSNINPRQEVTGLMGIMPPFEDVVHREVFAQLVSRGFCEPVFAMCLHRGNTSHGTFTVGGVDVTLGEGPLVYVPNVGQDSLPSFYGVHVTTIKVGGVEIAYNGTSILDSGTNIVVAPTAIMASLRRAICKDKSLPYCTQLWQGKCAKLSDADVSAYPSIHFNLGVLSIELFSRDYLLLGSPLAPTVDHYCLGISDGGQALFLLGDTLLRNYYVVHDLGRRQIGWARVNKDRCGSLPEQRASSMISVFV